MIEPENWTDRTWSFSLPVTAFPNVLERVRGTPVRAAELVAGLADSATSMRIGNSWSVKEHVAHLDDLYELDETRLAEFTAGADVLTAADMSNSRTETARHNETTMLEILERFRRHREDFVTKLESLSEETIVVSCLHARLGQRLRLIDWVYFIAEHDDHHLVRARRALLSLRELGNLK